MKKNFLIFIPSIEDGGVEKNLFLLSNYLSDKIKNVEILTCNFNYKHFFKKEIKFIGTKSKFFFNKSRYIKYIICLLILIKRIIKDKNILIFAFQANIYAIIVAKIFKIKIITRSNSAPQGWSKNFIKQAFFGFFLKKADSIIVNSINFKKEMDKKYKINTIFIYNPFEKNSIKNKINSKLNLKFFKKKDLKLITIGRLTDQKDHLTLLKAFSLVVKKRIDAKLLIIGKGKLNNVIEDFISENNLHDNVMLRGYIANPYKYLKVADIFVLSSKFEGLPNVLLEAQFLKRYIISTDCPTGPSEILLNGKAGDMFKIGDYKRLADLIMSYKFKNKKIKKMIKLATANFHRFDFKINCNKYYEVINKHL